VIERVIKAGERDFEEQGYTSQTLQELKTVWHIPDSALFVLVSSSI